MQGVFLGAQPNPIDIGVLRTFSVHPTGECPDQPQIGQGRPDMIGGWAPLFLKAGISL